jgi:hypothetical protein
LILHYQYYYDQNNLDTFVDISQKRLPIILILVLVGILVLQFVTNNQNSSMLIDPETCEIYIKDAQINGKQYLNEFDSKCLDMKNLNP